MDDQQAAIGTIFQRVGALLGTAKLGLKDMRGGDPGRRLPGLMNVITFGRSTTFTLQGLRGVLHEEFDCWYAPQQELMRRDPVMRYFHLARNELEKQGKLSVATNVAIRSFDSSDISKFGPKPPGATGFFVGDQAGGMGWFVGLPDGSTEKYYVAMDEAVGTITQHFTNLEAVRASEHRDRTVDDLAGEYIAKLTDMIEEAKGQFLSGR